MQECKRPALVGEWEGWGVGGGVMINDVLVGEYLIISHLFLYCLKIFSVYSGQQVEPNHNDTTTSQHGTLSPGLRGKTCSRK